MFLEAYICLSVNMFISLPSLWDRLSADGRRTLFLDLDSDALKPEGWDTLEDDKSTLHSFSDISIYELHIRDFR